MTPNENKSVKDTNEKELRIRLLELQVECLYSVLSEYDDDKNHFTQWRKAEAIRELLNYIRMY